jgi:hypothetical protein
MKDPFSRPAATGPNLVKELGEAMDNRKFHQTVNDPRFTAFFSWCAVILGGLFTAALCWVAASVMSMKSDIAVLLARPEGVTRSEYSRDAERWNSDIEYLKRREYDHSK